eukprot:2725969-Lingulodinium_polyedra.AAC.1
MLGVLLPHAGDDASAWPPAAPRSRDLWGVLGVGLHPPDPGVPSSGRSGCAIRDHTIRLCAGMGRQRLPELAAGFIRAGVVGSHEDRHAADACLLE